VLLGNTNEAAVYTRYGPLDVVQIMDVEKPVHFLSFSGRTKMLEARRT